MGGPRRWVQAARRAAADLGRSAAAAEKQVKVAQAAARAAESSATRTQKQLQTMAKALRAQSVLLEKVRAESARNADELRTLRIATTAPTMKDVHAFVAARQMSYRETLTALAEGEASFARFGDGELRLMVDPFYKLGFQVNSRELRESLRDVLGRPRDGLLVGWPRAFWTAHNTMMWSVIWDEVQPILPAEVRFGNSHVSRPDCFQALREEAVELWRQVWAGKRVAIVTGRGSRFDLVPQLFDNLAGHEFVYSEPRNAFADLDRLVDDVRNRPGVDLCLVALGPAGTVLAGRLAEAGVRTIDVGHISNSYANVFEGQPHPEKVPPVRVAQPDPLGA
ncbi:MULTISPECIES: GT-D fold domain-containing glycosyltransferase [unclassified Isoptericola]|uniref:GT-D fold domain-containing glycosyltransferase n=1 Tax=Isoptericola sp. NPDC057191 TaxID=3346041 RepID=UPI003631AE2C